MFRKLFYQIQSSTKKRLFLIRLTSEFPVCLGDQVSGQLKFNKNKQTKTSKVLKVINLRLL